MRSGFHGSKAFSAYHSTGLTAYEAGVGERFDRDAYNESGVVEYGVGLDPDRNAAFRARVVTEGTALLARRDAEKLALDTNARASARTSSNAELGGALTGRIETLGSRYYGVAPSDLALIAEAARRLRTL